ncbi:haloacid dehalogenase type II [Roseivirga sp. BDSF3-8]|uniref:haloacid dehalogenase type II n=1 Tax=Roseivirga sp. BDSF3-8 TaxID=3241598 RepID=UPI003531D0AB
MDKPVCFFDVNETLLDLSELRGSLKKNGGFSDETVSRWFTTLLHYSLVMTAGGRYADFGDIGAETLRMVAEEQGIKLSEAEAKEWLKPIRSLSPHADVQEGLAGLKKNGYRLVALTNGGRETLESQMGYAGLTASFDALLSVEGVEKFKPNREVYAWAAEQAGVGAAQCLMVAAHPWDIAGAAWAGWHTCYVQRSKTRPYGLAGAPDITVETLLELPDGLRALSRA